VTRADRDDQEIVRNGDGTGPDGSRLDVNWDHCFQQHRCVCLSAQNAADRTAMSAGDSAALAT
jgi:hypothetical protein